MTLDSACKHLIRLGIELAVSLLGAKTITAVNGAIAFGLKGHPSDSFALRTLHLGGATNIHTAALRTHQDAAIRTALGLIDQAPGTKKFLLAG